MQDYATTATIDQIIEYIFEKVSQSIARSSINDKLTTALVEEMLGWIHDSLDAMTLEQPRKCEILMISESLANIPLLEKDTLMPKYLSKSEKNDEKSAIIFTTIGLKKSLLGVRNTLAISTRQSSLISKTERPTRKSAIASESKCQKLEVKAEIQDPEIEILWKRTDQRIQSENQYKKLTLQRQQSFQQKLELMNSFELQNPSTSVTHDYDGEQIRSVLDQGKIKYYTINAGTGAVSKKIRQGNYLNPIEAKVELNRSFKEREASTAIRAMQMPLFNQPNHETTKMQGVKSYRLNEYRKHFGRGYSRLDQINRTIDYIPKQHPQDPFFEKKHLIDSPQTKTLCSSELRKSHLKKLALPKLKGIYKVLDRYEQP